MARKTNEHAMRRVAIEICRTTLHMVELSERGENQQCWVRTRSLNWRKEAHSLHTDAGVVELTAAVKQLVTEEQIAGFPVRIVLNGDFCVTRVLTGTADYVRREMAALKHRSQLYLSLGPGHKALAGCIRQIDARHQHALLTVSNQKTLEALMQVADGAGIRMELIEPSLVALSRMMGRLGLDQSEPTMVLNLGERGVELGISYQGRLLLDYRPGGRSVHDEVSDIVANHLARLQRYCYRYFRFAEGKLQRIYLCGSMESVEKVRKGFERQQQITVETLDLAKMATDWQFEDTAPSSNLAPAIGTCLIQDVEYDELNGPNLMEELDSQVMAPLVPGLLRAAWPVAAMLLIAATIFAATLKERWVLRGLQAQMVELAPQQAKSRQLRLTLTRAEAKSQHLATISQGVARPRWHELVSLLGGCMPADVWLDSFRLHNDGRMVISGRSYTNGGIFEFVGWLEKAPIFSNVALEQANPGRSQKGSAIGFQITCELADPAKFAGGDEGND